MTSAVQFSKPLALLASSSRRAAGVALVEVVIACSIVIATAICVTQMFIVSTKVAAVNRVLTAARVVVQRNLDNALTVRWDSSATPAVLAITSAAGVVYDDDGDNLNNEGANKIALLIEKLPTSGTPAPTPAPPATPVPTTYTVIPATMTRTVTKVPNSQDADIRKIRFTLTFAFQNRNQVVEMTTMRAIDD